LTNDGSPGFSPVSKMIKEQQTGIFKTPIQPQSGRSTPLEESLRKLSMTPASSVTKDSLFQDSRTQQVPETSYLRPPINDSLKFCLSPCLRNWLNQMMDSVKFLIEFSYRMKMDWSFQRRIWTRHLKVVINWSRSWTKQVVIWKDSSDLCWRTLNDKYKKRKVEMLWLNSIPNKHNCLYWMILM